MFQTGEFMIYGNNGLCEVMDVAPVEFASADKLYYHIVPVGSRNSRLFVPVDQTKVVMRRPISKEDALALIDRLPDLGQIETDNDRMREEKYKAAIQSEDCEELFRLIKTMYLRRQERLAAGRKVTALDERYMKAAKDHLYGELSYVLKTEKDDIDAFITERIETNA